MNPQLSDLDARIEKIIELLTIIQEYIVTDYTTILNAIKEDCNYLDKLNSVEQNIVKLSQIENQLADLKNNSDSLERNVSDIRSLCSDLQSIVSDIKTLMPSGGGSNYDLSELMNFTLTSAVSSNSLARKILDISSNTSNINSYIRFGNKHHVCLTANLSASDYTEFNFTGLDIESFSFYITKWTNNSGLIGTLQIDQFTGLIGTYTEEQIKCLNGIVFNVASTDSKITFTSVNAMVDIMIVAYK